MAKKNQTEQPGADGTVVGDDTEQSLAGAQASGASVGDSTQLEEGGETASPSTVLARVLSFCHLGAPNDVVEIDSELAKTMRDVVDTSPEAVSYAKSIGQE